MKKYIEMILRKIGVSMLALLMVMTTYFSNSGGSLFLKDKERPSRHRRDDTCDESGNEQ